MRNRGVLLTIVVLSTGCATLVPPPGKSAEDIARDKAECKRCVEKPTECSLPGSIPGTWKACMETKGYTPAKTAESGSPIHLWDFLRWK